MENYIIAAVLLALVAVGVGYTVRHFQHKSGCCGGGSYRVRPKRLSKVLYKKTFRVEGMHCDACAARVTEVINDVPGLSARVDGKRGLMTVSYAADVPAELIRDRLARVGYTLGEER